MYHSLGHRMQRLADYLNREAGPINYIYFRENVEWSKDVKQENKTFPIIDEFENGLKGIAIKRPRFFSNYIISALKRLLKGYKGSKLGAKLTNDIHRKEAKYLSKAILKHFPSTEILISFGPWAGIACVDYKNHSPNVNFIYEDVDFYPGFCGEQYAHYVSLMEIESIKCADLTVSVSPNLAELRKNQGSKNVIIIPNGTSNNILNKTKPEYISSAPRLVWVGYIDDWVAIDEFLDAIKLLIIEYPEISFELYGGGPLTNYLEKQVSEKELDNHVKFLGRIDFNKLPEVFSRATIGVAPFKDNIVMKYACTLKVRDYMAAGLPILTTDIGELKDLMKESGAGIAVKPNSKDFAEGVRYLLRSSIEWKTKSNNGRDWAKNSEWEILFNNELDEILKLANRP